MLKLENGTNSFYQWDLDQRFIVTEINGPAAIHFWQQGLEKVLEVEPYTEGDKIMADVPNILLQNASPITAYIYRQDIGAYTSYKRVFQVFERERPAGYVYTETEARTWDALDGRVKKLEEVGAIIAAIQQDIADLKYVPIDIIHITNSVGVVEMGSTVNRAVVSWTTNKAPVSLTVDGAAVDATANSITFDTPITANKTFTVIATDERGATDTATTSITFYNGVYYGVGTANTNIGTLTKKLQGSKGITFTVNAGEGQNILFALPARYGTPNFNVGSFDGGFHKINPINFTNASGYTEEYDVWVSDNTGLGNTTVKVS